MHCPQPTYRRRAALLERDPERLLYNSTSPKQREYVFNATKPEIVAIATHAVALIEKA